MNSCGMIRSFGRLGDFGRPPSGVGGSTSILISGVSSGRVGIGRKIGGVFRFGKMGMLLLLSSKTTLIIPPAPYL